ncbi:MAG: hypothetical protein P8M25_18240 [Paracoccaceae bacterium]|jgi:hypothetical protein|nr:hypothetical protein [Paracoccaceae bacterium]
METLISVNGVKMTVRQFHLRTQYDSEGDELILVGAGTMKLKDFRVLSPEQQDILDVRPNLEALEGDG